MAYIQDWGMRVQAQPQINTTRRAFLYLSQNENGRMLNIRITDVNIPAGSTAVLAGTKPDGTVYSQTGTLAGNTATFAEDVQMTAVAGTWDAKITVTNGGNCICTARITITIDPDTVAGGAIPSDSQLDGIIAECRAIADSVRKEAYGSPLVADAVEDMTDQSRVYVYTGSESGMTAGHWYYYNGSVWADGGVYNAAALDTDKTLSVPDKAADGKATGDALALKVDKVTGKGLSTNDYTTAEKTKLSGIAEGATKVEIDSTLSTAGKAADAKKVGDELADVKEDLSKIITPTAEGWEQGGINSTDGVSLLTTTTRIRTIDYLPNNVGVIKAINGYTFALFAYDSFETYLGNYNNGAFVKSLNFVSEADIRDFDKGNKYKLVVRRYHTTQDIAPAECINIECISFYSDVNASEIDSVKKINGMNLFTTFDVESGGINLTNGEDVALTTRIRTGYIQANAGTYIKCDDGFKFAVAEYTSFGGGLYSFVDGSYVFVKEYTVKNNAYIRCSMAYNKEGTIDVTSKEHLKIYVKNEPIWSDIYVRKIPRFEQGGLLNSDNTETPVNNQNYLTRVRTAPIHVKAGSWVEPLTGFSILLREQKTNANGSEIYNLDNYISWTTGRVYVQHDCYLRIVGRKTNGSNVTPGEFGVRHYLLGKKEDPLLQFPLAEDSYNSVGSHEATIFFGKTANDVYTLWDAFVDNSYCTKVNIGKDSSGLYDLASYNFVPAQVYSMSKPLNGSGLRKDNVMKVMLITGLHGGEKPAVLALYNLMYNVINHWKENKILEFIRWNVELYVLPLLCPYAFDNLDVTHGRVNYNHVNINRNFDCRYWDLGSSDSTSFDYRGSSPNSELETRTVVFLAKSITPDVLYDIHTYGDGSSYSKMFAWDNSGDGLPQGYMAEIGAEVIKATTLNGVINHELPDNNLYISQINQDEKIAFVSQWATENGIYSATPELTYKLFGDTKTGDEAQTLDIREINEEFIANAIYYAAKAKYSGRTPMNKAE